MKYAALFLLLTLSLVTVLAQPPKARPTSVKKSPPVKAKISPTPTPVPLSEKEQFEKASGYELAADRVAALDKFLVDFPQSESRPAAAELLASSRILIAEEKLISGDAAEAVEIYKKLINDYPAPFPADFYTDTISKIPQTLYFRGQRGPAAEIANFIETKVESDTGQLLEMANFYLRIENGSEAMRVAAKAAAKDPSSGAVYRTIALAHRISFDLELSADAYAKSLELDPDSVVSKRGLADMKRALGKPEEAVVLYRDLVAKSSADTQARNGLILALFESNKRAEAEAELAKSLEQSPNNVALLAGAAFWYASRGAGDKAVELAQKALSIEPRYIWSHIALARGFVKQGKPVAAEQVLIKARGFASFPTLEYELASVRMAAGFFREAVDDLAKHFSVTDDGVRTRLGGRIMRTEKSIADLAAAERRASIFAHDGGESSADSERLRGLLLLDEELQEDQPSEDRLGAAADVFTGGTDKMRFHRQVFAASEMLKRRVAAGKVLELAKAATGNADAALEVADPGAAVMAAELYEPRQAAFRKNDFLLVPDVPRPVLSSIFRERIEELAGWALYLQGNYSEATIRLRRAVTVAPAKSAWSRAAMWRLGASLAAEGKDTEALNAYVDSYKEDAPDYAKFVIVETLYKKVNGSTDGLEARIGPKRVLGSPISSEPESPVAPITTTEAPPTTSITENSSTQSTAAPITPTKLTIDRSRDLFKAIPSSVPVDRSAETGNAASRTVESSSASKSEAIPEAIPSVEKKHDAPTAEIKKDEPIPSKQEPSVEVKKNEPVVSTEVKKDEAASVDVKKDEPASTEVKKDEPPPTELKKDEPPPVKVKKDEQPPTELKKDEPVKKDEPPPVEVKKDEAIPAEVKKDEPASTEVKKVEPSPAEVKSDEPKKDDPPPVEPKKDEPAEVKKDEPAAPPSIGVRKTDPLADTKADQKTEAVNSELKTTSPPLKVDDQKAASRKPLFQPIIITIPNSRPKPTATEATSKTDDKPAADEKAKDKTASGEARPRLIDGQEVKVDNIPPCTITVSKERISVVNNGGKVGLLVGFDGPGDITTLRGTSSSPRDVEVHLEPEISGMPDRRFFVIKSVSAETGAYQVTFTMPCGIREILVTVQ